MAITEETTEVVKSCDKWLKLRFPHNALAVISGWKRVLFSYH